MRAKSRDCPQVDVSTLIEATLRPRLRSLSRNLDKPRERRLCSLSKNLDNLPNKPTGRFFFECSGALLALLASASRSRFALPRSRSASLGSLAPSARRPARPARPGFASLRRPRLALTSAPSATPSAKNQKIKNPIPRRVDRLGRNQGQASRLYTHAGALVGSHLAVREREGREREGEREGKGRGETYRGGLG